MRRRSSAPGLERSAPSSRRWADGQRRLASRTRCLTSAETWPRWRQERRPRPECASPRWRARELARCAPRPRPRTRAPLLPADFCLLSFSRPAAPLCCASPPHKSVACNFAPRLLLPALRVSYPGLHCRMPLLRCPTHHYDPSPNGSLALPRPVPVSIPVQLSSIVETGALAASDSRCTNLVAPCRAVGHPYIQIFVSAGLQPERDANPVAQCCQALLPAALARCCRHVTSTPCRHLQHAPVARSSHHDHLVRLLRRPTLYRGCRCRSRNACPPEEPSRGVELLLDSGS